MRSTFSIACCRDIPYSRRFRSVKVGACASAASPIIPLLPAIAGLSLPVPVHLSSIIIGCTIYCCLPSTYKNKSTMRGDAEQKPGEQLLCGERETYQLFSSYTQKVVIYFILFNIESKSYVNKVVRALLLIKINYV